MTKLIVALDVSEKNKAKEIVNKLAGIVKYFKIGSQLFAAHGPEVVEMVGKKGGKVFLDLKFHDIPNTVQNACYTSTGTGSIQTFTFSKLYTFITSYLKFNEEIKKAMQFPVFMMTVHASVGEEGLIAAKKGAEARAGELNIPKPLIVGVTVLTSENLGENTLKEVIRRARIAYDAGLDGVVCSVHETAEVRREFGQNFVIVNPGIRPLGVEKNEQKRVATPKAAKNAGADYIVVGRPIVEARNPVKAAEDILAEIA